MAGGRPTKCTPEVIAQFADYMQKGAYLTEASAMVGIIDDTAQNWLRDGKAALQAAGNDLDAIEGENERLWARFFATVTRAEAIALLRNIGHVQHAAQDRPKVLRRRDPDTGEVQEMEPGDWRAAAEFLKMRRPDTWGMRKQATELSGPGGGPVEVEHELDPAGVAEAFRGLVSLATGDDDNGA